MNIRTPIIAASLFTASMLLPYSDVQSETITKQASFQVVASGKAILRTRLSSNRKTSRPIGGDQVEAVDIEKFDASKGTLTGVTVRLRNYQALSSGALGSRPRVARKRAAIGLAQSFKVKSDLLQPQQSLFRSSVNYPFRSQELAKRFTKNDYSYSNQPGAPVPAPDVVTIKDQTALQNVTGTGNFPIEIRETDVYRIRSNRQRKATYTFGGQTVVNGTIEVVYEYTPANK